MYTCQTYYLYMQNRFGALHGKLYLNKVGFKRIKRYRIKNRPHEISPTRQFLVDCNFQTCWGRWLVSFILLLMLSISFIYPFISLGGGVLRQGHIQSRLACNYLAEISIELLISLLSTSQTLGLQAQSPYLTCILLKSEKKKSFKFLCEDLVSIKIWFQIIME